MAFAGRRASAAGLSAILTLWAIGGIGGATSEGPLTVPADDLVAARQDGMVVIGSLLEVIMETLGNGADIKALEDSGTTIAAWSMAMPGLFPEGTEHGHKTRASPEIWSDRPGFEQAVVNLTEAARDMAKAAAADNQPEFITAFRSTILACAACHFTYRVGGD